jgi:hypothetical protein
MTATSESAEISGSFSSGPASWNVPTPCIVLGGKNLGDTINNKRGGGGKRMANPGAADADLALLPILAKTVEQRLDHHLHFPKRYFSKAVLRPYNVVTCYSLFQRTE